MMYNLFYASKWNYRKLLSISLWVVIHFTVNISHIICILIMFLIPDSYLILNIILFQFISLQIYNVIYSYIILNKVHISVFSWKHYVSELDFETSTVKLSPDTYNFNLRSIFLKTYRSQIKMECIIISSNSFMLIPADCFQLTCFTNGFNKSNAILKGTVLK